MSSLRYPPKIRLLGEKLMHHQCWFFGRDILYADGNLLIRYGFERFGVPGLKELLLKKNVTARFFRQIVYSANLPVQIFPYSIH